MVAERDHVLDIGGADGQRAGLVEQHGPRPPSVSIAPAPLTITPLRAARESPETSAIGAARISGHGVATTTTASARTGSPLSAHASPATASVTGGTSGVAVGHPHEGARWACACSTSRTRPRTRSRPPGVGAHVERRAGVGGPAHHRHPAAQRDGQRLAAERARVDDRLGAHHGAVDGDHLAGAHEHHVARHHRVDGDLLERVVDVQARHVRGALDQARELAPRSPRCRRLERGAAGEHQADHDPGEQLVERERAEHGDQRDRVDPQVAVDDHRAPDLDRQLGREQRDRRAPDPVAGGVLAEQMQQPTRDDRDQRDGGQHLRAMIDQPPSAAAQTAAESRATRKDRCGGRGHDPRLARPSAPVIRTATGSSGEYTATARGR